MNDLAKAMRRWTEKKNLPKRKASFCNSILRSTCMAIGWGQSCRGSKYAALLLMKLQQTSTKCSGNILEQKHQLNWLRRCASECSVGSRFVAALHMFVPAWHIYPAVWQPKKPKQCSSSHDVELHTSKIASQAQFPRGSLGHSCRVTKQQSVSTWKAA